MFLEEEIVKENEGQSDEDGRAWERGVRIIYPWL